MAARFVALVNLFAAVTLKGYYFGFFSFLWLSRAISIAVFLKRCEDCWLTKRQNDLAKKTKEKITINKEYTTVKFAINNRMGKRFFINIYWTKFGRTI